MVHWIFGITHMRILKCNFRILMLFCHHFPGAGRIENVLRYTSFASAKGGLNDL